MEKGWGISTTQFRRLHKMTIPGYSIDFIPASRLNSLSDNEIVDFVFERIDNEHVLILESPLTPQLRLELTTRGLLRFSADFIGIKMQFITIRTEISGIFRGKSKDSTLLVIAPGNAEIDHSEDGDVSVKFPVSESVEA